jgi:cathepsin F
MLRLVLLVSLSLVLGALAIHSETDALKLFTQFQVKYNKNYATEEEREARFEAFKANLLRIDELNRKNGEPAFGITKFADMSQEEFREKYLMKTPLDRSRMPRAEYARPARKDVQSSNWDWGKNRSGIVTPVKNQQQCGSCWAFSATETIESVWALSNQTLPVLAPQQIVDCDSVDQGCGGGWPYHAYEYVINTGGMMPQSDYKYTGQNGECKFDASEVVAHINSWMYVSTDPSGENSTMLPYLAYNSPLSICVDASSWSLYNGGILHTCTDQIDHCVQLTGFQMMDNKQGVSTPVWNVRNSWGADWGESGYIFVERGRNLCAIATVVTVPAV